MARSHLRHNVHDTQGNAIQNARVKLYLVGSTTPVSDAWNAPTGGALVTDLISNAQGEVEAWLDAPKQVDLVVTDNSGTAHVAGAAQTPSNFDDHRETVNVIPPADRIPSLGDNGLLPVEIIPSGSVSESNVPEVSVWDSLFGAIDLTGVSDVRPNLALADAAGITKRFRSGTYRIATNITLTGHLRLHKGAVLAPDAGVTVTLDCTWSADRWQIFGGAGTFIPGPNCRMPSMFPEWWGAKGDVRFLYDGDMTSGATGLTSATAGWTSADVGKMVYSITALGIQSGSVVSSVSGTTAQLSLPATATSTGIWFGVGSNDYAPIMAAYNFQAAMDRGGEIRFDERRYGVNNTILVKHLSTAIRGISTGSQPNSPDLNGRGTRIVQFISGKPTMQMGDDTGPVRHCNVTDLMLMGAGSGCQWNIIDATPGKPVTSNTFERVHFNWNWAHGVDIKDRVFINEFISCTASSNGLAGYGSNIYADGHTTANNKWLFGRISGAGNGCGFETSTRVGGEYGQAMAFIGAEWSNNKGPAILQGRYSSFLFMSNHIEHNNEDSVAATGGAIDVATATLTAGVTIPASPTTFTLTAGGGFPASWPESNGRAELSTGQRFTYATKTATELQGCVLLSGATGSVSSGATINRAKYLTITSSTFRHYWIERYVEVPGAGPAGASFESIIRRHISENEVELYDAASTTVTGQNVTLEDGPSVVWTGVSRGVSIIGNSFVGSAVLRRALKIVADDAGNRATGVDMLGNSHHAFTSTPPFEMYDGTRVYAVYQDMEINPENWTLGVSAANQSNTTRDNTFRLSGAYWDGTRSRLRSAFWKNDVTATTPASRQEWGVDTTVLMRLLDTGVLNLPLGGGDVLTTTTGVGATGASTKAGELTLTDSLRVATTTINTGGTTGLDSRHHTVLVDAAGAARTILLPTAVGITGRQYVIKKTDASTNSVNINTTSSQTIDGVTSIVLKRRYSFVVVESDGANWVIVASNRFDVMAAGALVGTRPAINFVDASSVVDDATNGKIDVTIGAGAGGGVIRRVQAADQIVNNSTTLVDSTNLQFAADTGTYQMLLVIDYNSTSTADFKVRITGGSGKVTWLSFPDTATGGTVNPELTTVSIGSDRNVGGVGGDRTMIGFARVVMAAPGDIKVQVAQKTADATDSKLLAGSWLEAAKV